MQRFAWIFLLLCGACGDNEARDLSVITCDQGTVVGGTLMQGGDRVVVPDGTAHELAGAAVAAQPKTDVPTTVTIECAAPMLPDGVVALGPAVKIGPALTASDRPFLITLPYDTRRLPAGAGRRHVRVLAWRARGDGTPFFSPVADFRFDDQIPWAARLTFAAEELATYQVVARADAGQPVTRAFTYRAIAGVSMGGGAATALGLRHPEKWDLIGDLGGEPGPSIRYSLDMVGNFLFGGFAARRAPYKDLFELTPDYEHFTYQAGAGVGLTLDRALYMQAARDLSKALGNPTLYNPASAYLPPGVPESFLTQADRCTNPTVLTGFHDARFNPTGSLPVITFCDGGDSTRLGLGVFDPTLAQTNAPEVLLAVDVNGNGQRDQGEPVIVQPYEPFADVGSDGLPDEMEPGYDPITNPDPNGDDYHPVKNPRGTEKNGWRDPGEPFQDVGLDGVAATGDYGEGDGSWTVNPNLQRWMANDAGTNLRALSAADRARVHIYMDAGVRDFFSGQVAAAAFAGDLAAAGVPLGIYDGFHSLDGSASDDQYDFRDVVWSDLPENLFVRYGDPDASEAAIEAGDGRHVGTPAQLVARLESVFGWIDARWPGGDRAIVADDGMDFVRDQHFTGQAGRDTPYAVFLPPGYSTQTSLSYPVVYFMHGYGQNPEDLIGIAGVFASYMIDPRRPEPQRLQKMIIVFVDGACRSGDGCETGTFYMNSPVNAQPQMEDLLYELTAEIDAKYRTKAAATVTVTP